MIIAALVTSPAVIKGQWTVSRLRRQVADLENDRAEFARRFDELESKLARLGPPSQPDAARPKSYVGLKTLIAGGNSEAPKK